MKAIELRAKTESDLQKELIALLREQFNLRMQNGTGQLKAKHQLQRVRRAIARVKTIMHHKQFEKTGG